MKFGPGDVVTLKSGGSKMTVQSTRGDTVFVVWFNNADKFETKSLPSSNLELVKPMLVERKADAYGR
jgi:uncharacterized protein YodC (DUF2158 family)